MPSEAASVAKRILTGETDARFRSSVGGGLTATGRGLDGEVEDYRVSVLGPPAVESIQVNAGADQRSTVSELT